MTGVFICSVVVIVAFSWYLRLRNDYFLAIILLILAGIILRVYLASDTFLHPWDERYHALVAKNLMNHPLKPTLIENPILPFNHQYWTGNHVWLHKPPVSLWSIMLSYKLFGVSVLATRIPSILFSTLSILITYSLGKDLFDKKIGYMAAFLFSINGFVIEMSSGRIPTDHVDVCFMFLILLSIFLAFRFTLEKKTIYNVLCGAILGLAILTKWLPAIIVLPVWLGFVLSRTDFNYKKIILHLSTLLFIAFAIVFLWQYHIWTEFPIEAKWENDYNVDHLNNSLEGHSKHVFFHFDIMRISFGELIYLPLLWFLYKVLRYNRTKWESWGLLIWAIFPFLFFTFVATKMPAYTLFTAPILLIITSYFFYELRLQRKTIKQKWSVDLLCALFLFLPIRYTFERVKPFQEVEFEKNWNNELISFAKTIQHQEKTIVYNVENDIELMFYSNVTAYPYDLSIDVVDSLQRRGFVVINYRSQE